MAVEDRVAGGLVAVAGAAEVDLVGVSGGCRWKMWCSLPACRFLNTTRSFW
jgi:hypothetical protein